MVERGRARRLIPLRPWISGGGATEVTLRDVRTRAETAFVLVYATSMSRPGADRGQCASGGEENLIWLAIGPWLRPVRAQSVLTYSCLKNVDTEEAQPTRFVGDTLRLTVADGRTPATVRVWYDRRHPERGIAVDTLAAPGR